MNKYSVLMSVYYKEKSEYLEQSVTSVMKQTLPPNDFVLVCDGPLTDELYKTIDELVKKYPVINVIKLEENSGLGVALMEGFNHVKNEIIMRMDSDDLCLPNRAELQLPLMDKYDLVGGFISEFDGAEDNIIGIRRVPETAEEIYKFAKKRNPFNHPSTMYKKSAILAVGGYQHLLYLEDYYLWIRFLLANKNVYNVQEVLVNMRSGVKMRVRRGSKEAKKSLKVLRKFMYKSKFINWFEYVFVTFGQFFILSLPMKIKTHIYAKYLRS